MLPSTDMPLRYDRWWISLNSFGTFSGTMPTGDVRKTGKGAVSKSPAILLASSSLDTFENRISGFCSALLKLRASNEVISLMKLIRKPKGNRWLNIVLGFGRSPQGAVQTISLLRELPGNCPETRAKVNAPVDLTGFVRSWELWFWHWVAGCFAPHLKRMCSYW